MSIADVDIKYGNEGYDNSDDGTDGGGGGGDGDGDGDAGVVVMIWRIWVIQVW
jgi:hypothetical protein